MSLSSCSSLGTPRMLTCANSNYIFKHSALPRKPSDLSKSEDRLQISFYKPNKLIIKYGITVILHFGLILCVNYIL
jgi:hypothetical protein